MGTVCLLGVHLARGPRGRGADDPFLWAKAIGRTPSLAAWAEYGGVIPAFESPFGDGDARVRCEDGSWMGTEVTAD